MNKSFREGYLCDITYQEKLSATRVRQYIRRSKMVEFTIFEIEKLHNMQQKTVHFNRSYYDRVRYIDACTKYIFELLKLSEFQ